MARRELSRHRPRWSPAARLGLPVRFALTLVVVGLPIGIVGTQLVVDRQVAALEANAEANLRGVLQLLESSVTNLVVTGDISGLHDVLGDVRRHEGVTDTFVVDEAGLVLADGTAGEDRRFTRPELHDEVLAAIAASPGEIVVFEHGEHLDTALPLMLGDERIGICSATSASASPSSSTP